MKNQAREKVRVYFKNTYPATAKSLNEKLPHVYNVVIEAIADYNNKHAALPPEEPKAEEPKQVKSAEEIKPFIEFLKEIYCVEDGDDLQMNITLNPQLKFFIEANQRYAQQFQSTPISKWIPLKERLPEVGVDVLVFSENEGVNKSFYAGEKPKGKNRYKYHAEFPDGQDDQPGQYRPTHWMPLPEPPKPLKA